VLENQAALKIQGTFFSYRVKKQTLAQHAISTSPASKLLQAFDLRFQCMRAVAAAKFPINKPIEDPAQVERVLNSIKELAKDKGIINLDAVQQLFKQNIFLAEQIQSSYYNLIWRKSYYDGAPDNQKLINNAYAQLSNLVHSSDLPILHHRGNTVLTSEDVLALVRNIIQYASITMIQILADSTTRGLQAVSQEGFAEIIEKMLANYMTPSILAHSKENVRLLSKKVIECSVR
jgi:chorismate mutase